MTSYSLQLPGPAHVDHECARLPGPTARVAFFFFKQPASPRLPIPNPATSAMLGVHVAVIEDTKDLDA
jgi:hypothetical protein